MRDALAADREKARALVNVSRETWARLDAFVDLLVKWQQTTNLIAPSTLPEIWTRHVADSLQLRSLAPNARRWLDLGSGGGFPGIVLGCQLANEMGGSIQLVERTGKKAAFLREAARVTATPVRVHAADIVDYVDRLSEPVDCITARALAPLKVLLEFIFPLIQRGSIALLPKGQDVAAELTEASRYWNMDAETLPSLTHPQARIVRVTRLERRAG